mgnify:FL=1
MQRNAEKSREVQKRADAGFVIRAVKDSEAGKSRKEQKRAEKGRKG